MSTLTQTLVDVGFNVRRAEAIEAAVLGLVVDAASVTFTPAGDIAATDVQAAIEELDTEKGDVNGPNGGVTDGHAVLFDSTTGKLIKTAGAAPYVVGGTDVPVADGGSGRSAATEYAVICGGTTSTGAHQSIAGVGSSGQVLTSNGAGNLPTFQTPAGGSVTIASGNLSGNAVTITGIPETYAYLVLHIAGGSFDTAARSVLVRASTNNGSSYDATAGNYPGDFWDGTTYTSTTLASLVESASIALAAGTFTLTITIFNYHTGPHKLAEFRYVDSAAAVTRGRVWYVGATDNIDALQIINSGTGNFDAGTYALYGIS